MRTELQTTVEGLRQDAHELQTPIAAETQRHAVHQRDRDQHGQAADRTDEQDLADPIAGDQPFAERIIGGEEEDAGEIESDTETLAAELGFGGHFQGGWLVRVLMYETMPYQRSGHGDKRRAKST